LAGTAGSVAIAYREGLEARRLYDNAQAACAGIGYLVTNRPRLKVLDGDVGEGAGHARIPLGLCRGYRIGCLGVSGYVQDKPDQRARYADAAGTTQGFLSRCVRPCPYARANCHGARRGAGGLRLIRSISHLRAAHSRRQARLSLARGGDADPGYPRGAVHLRLREDRRTAPAHAVYFFEHRVRPTLRLAAQRSERARCDHARGIRRGGARSGPPGRSGEDQVGYDLSPARSPGTAPWRALPDASVLD